MEILNNTFKPTESSHDKNIAPRPKRTFQKKSPIDNGIVISYNNFIKDKVKLAAFKLKDLKDATKSYKLPVTGTKQVLIQRLETYFKRVKNAIAIQSMFRGRLARVCIHRRGLALRNRRLCVNDTDFVTMDPINEISTLNFFSYTDEKDFTYGFHIASLMHLVKSTGKKTVNPYNREKMTIPIIRDILLVYNASHLIFESFREENSSQLIMHNRTIVHTRTTQRQPQQHITRTQMIHQIVNGNNAIQNQYAPDINQSAIVDDESLARLNHIREIRTRTNEQRIHELFSVIDQLGNYTQSSWFTNLSHADYGRLYRALYEIWNFRAQMPRSVRNKISPFHGPFDAIFHRLTVHPSDLNYIQLQTACLIVIENMVYSGVDEDHRKLGTFHALSGLTMVSLPARNSMPWLYESLV